MSKHIVCNKCGKSSLNAKDSFSVNLFHNFTVEFTYGSEDDGTVWRFDLCEDCVKEYVKSFHVPLDEDDIEEGFF